MVTSARLSSKWGVQYETTSFFKCLAIFCLSVSILLTKATQAMDIVEFDKMTDGDRQAYLDFIVEATRNILIAQDRRCGRQGLPAIS